MIKAETRLDVEGEWWSSICKKLAWPSATTIGFELAGCMESKVRAFPVHLVSAGEYPQA